VRWHDKLGGGCRSGAPPSAAAPRSAQPRPRHVASPYGVDLEAYPSMAGKNVLITGEPVPPAALHPAAHAAPSR
jgi:hypothetical protein